MSKNEGLIRDITWDSILENMRSHEDVSNAQFKEFEEAFHILEKYLGKNFPSQVDSRKHPLAFPLVHNLAPFPKHWISWFAHSIRKLSGQKNFHVLIRKLRHSKQFIETMDFVRFSVKLISAGWSIEFEPELEGRKCPDLLATSPSGKQVLVEMSSLGESDKDKNTSKGIYLIVLTLGRVSTDYAVCGRLMKLPMTIADFDSIKRETSRFRDRLLKDQRYIVHRAIGVVELCGAPMHMQDRVGEWASERDLQVGKFLYANDEDDVLRRITGRIKEKHKQLSEYNLPALVVLRCNDFANEGDELEDRSIHIAKELSRYPQLIGSLIFGLIYDESRDVHFALPEFSFIEVSGSRFETEKWIFIYNKYSLFPLKVRDFLYVEIVEALMGEGEYTIIE